MSINFIDENQDNLCVHHYNTQNLKCCKTFQVNFPSGVKAELGNELTPTQVKDQPSVKWAAKPNSFYTLYLAGKLWKHFNDNNINYQTR